MPYSTQNLHGLMQRSSLLSEAYCLPKIIDTLMMHVITPITLGVRIATEEAKFK
jgi:hypothetical protein